MTAKLSSSAVIDLFIISADQLPVEMKGASAPAITFLGIV